MNDINNMELNKQQKTIKRIFDVVLSVLIIIFILPLLMVIAIVVKLSSRGPVFVKQRRIDFNGKILNLYKFRTMRVDAEFQNVIQAAMKYDRRITRVGSFLRKTSLDELPLFINVIIGDMSIVGPRAMIPAQYERYNEIYNGIINVKPGITGYAQINGWYGNIDSNEHVKYDEYYLKNWSIYLDIKIIWLTIFKGFFVNNSY